MESLPLRTAYYERNGIEVVLLVDEGADYRSLLASIRKYPFISWKVMSGSWQNRAAAYNEGIRQSIKEYVLLMFPESLFETDVIYELRETLDEYPQHYAVGFSFGSLMVRKEHLELVGGYDEQYDIPEGVRREPVPTYGIGGHSSVVLSGSLVATGRKSLVGKLGTKRTGGSSV